MSKFKKVKIDEIIFFTKEMATLLRAGVPILTALEALAANSTKPMSKVLNKVYVDIVSGKSFSQALKQQPEVFSKFIVAAVQVGEINGTLAEVLEKMTAVLRHNDETKKKVKSALRYPIFVTSVIIVAFIVIMFLVVPKFTLVFSRADMELPLLTKMLMASSDFMQKNILVIFGTIGIGIFGFNLFIKTKPGRYWWDSFIMKIPLVGPLVLKSAMAHFTKMFAMLYQSGLPILPTLSAVAVATGNKVIEKTVMNVAADVEKGEGIVESMKKYKLFPPMVTRMISIGEQSGSLGDILGSIANHYDMEVEYATKKLTSMVEPALTIILGAFVVILALAIFLPMWDIAAVVQ